MPQPALSPEEILRRAKAPYAGQARKSRAKSNSAGIAGGRPKAPQHLCPDALIEFRRVSKLLGARKTETPGDASTLAVYSEVYSRWVQAKRELGTELMIDVTILDSNGVAHTTSKLNPLLRVIENCEGRLLALAKAMGLTPDTREKVKPAKPDQTKLPLPEGSVGAALIEFNRRKNAIDVESDS